MGAPLIEHVGILVADLEAAIERWSAVTGYTFSPIVRYRTTHYVDRSDPEEHLHDARISLSREGPPRIELMEATGNGTHAVSELGVHHFGINGVTDIETRMTELAALGVEDDGQARTEDGNLHLWFTRKTALDGVRIEYVSPAVLGPMVADDGTPLRKDPRTGRWDIWERPRRDASGAVGGS